MLILVALVGHAEGGVLSFKDVQIAHLVAAVADGEGDGEGVIQQERLGIPKRRLPALNWCGEFLFFSLNFFLIILIRHCLRILQNFSLRNFSKKNGMRRCFQLFNQFTGQISTALC